MRLRQLGFDLGQAAGGGQHLRDFAAVQAARHTGLDQHRAVRQVLAKLEVGAEQRLPDRVLHAVLAGQPQHPMCRQRGHPHLAPAEVHRQAFRTRRGLGLAEDLLGALDATELAHIGLAQRHRGVVRVRVQLERLPVDIEFRRIGAQQLHALLETMLADPAPGTDHVGVDVDSHPPDMGPAPAEKRGRRGLSRFPHRRGKDDLIPSVPFSGFHHCE